MTAPREAQTSRRLDSRIVWTRAKVRHATPVATIAVAVVSETLEMGLHFEHVLKVCVLLSGDLACPVNIIHRVLPFSGGR